MQQLPSATEVDLMGNEFDCGHIGRALLQAEQPSIAFFAFAASANPGASTIVSNALVATNTLIEKGRWEVSFKVTHLGSLVTQNGL